MSSNVQAFQNQFSSFQVHVLFRLPLWSTRHGFAVCFEWSTLAVVLVPAWTCTFPSTTCIHFGSFLHVAYIWLLFLCTCQFLLTTLK